MNATPAAKAPAPIPSLAVFVVAAYAGLQMLSDVASLKIGVVMGFAVDMGTFIYPFTFTLRDMAHKLVGKRGVRTLVVTAAAVNLFDRKLDLRVGPRSRLLEARGSRPGLCGLRRQFRTALERSGERLLQRERAGRQFR